MVCKYHSPHHVCLISQKYCPGDPDLIHHHICHHTRVLMCQEVTMQDTLPFILRLNGEPNAQCDTSFWWNDDGVAPLVLHMHLYGGAIVCAFMGVW